MRYNGRCLLELPFCEPAFIECQSQVYAKRIVAYHSCGIGVYPLEADVEHRTGIIYVDDGKAYAGTQGYLSWSFLVVDEEVRCSVSCTKSESYPVFERTAVGILAVLCTNVYLVPVIKAVGVVTHVFACLL